VAITTTSTLPSPVQQSFSLKLLSVKVPNLIHKIPADQYRLPRHGGNTLRMRRYNPLQTSLVPLGNGGVTPPSQNLTAIDIDAKVSWYGSWVEINEQVVLQNQEAVLNECARRLGVAMRQSEDELTRDMLAATATVLNCTGGLNGDNPTDIELSDVQLAVRTLLDNDAYTLMDGIDGEDKFGTGPVRRAYFALCSTSLTPDLEGVDTFRHVNAYPAPNQALPSEWGSIGNLRFLISSIGSVTRNASALGNDIYNIFCVGLESYACVLQDGASAQFIYLPPIFSGPLAQNVTVGYKFAEVPRITNDQWLINLRTTLSV